VDTAQPSLSLDLITDGLLTIIRATCNTAIDLAIAGGTES